METKEAFSINSPEVLVCDLDGTLVAGDWFTEALACAFFKRPHHFLAASWFLIRKNPSRAKQFLLERNSDFSAAHLPYRQEVLDFLQQRKSDGARLILATGAPRTIALQVANYLGCFEHILGTEREYNLVGENKKNALSHFLQTNKFEYIGDSKADIAVWKFSKRAVLAGPAAKSPSLQNTLRNEGVSIRTLSASALEKKGASNLCTNPSLGKILLSMLSLMRVHQWTKNLLIFFPFLLYYHFEVSTFLLLLFGFIAFCLIASSVYIANDLADLHHDRNHPQKRNRALASGRLTVNQIFPLPFFLFGTSILISTFLDAMTQQPVTLGLIGYFLLSMLYTSVLKRHLIIDVATLSILYLSRLLIGHLIGNIPFSFWLSAFCVFQFFTFSLVKRCSELKREEFQKDTVLQQVPESTGRAYFPGDYNLLRTIGVTGAMMAVLVYAFYTHGNEVLVRYQFPYALGLVGISLLIINLRLWVFVERGQLKEDPVAFMLKDKVFWCFGFISILTLLLSSKWFYGKFLL